jgi:hypothetical protein
MLQNPAYSVPVEYTDTMYLTCRGPVPEDLTVFDSRLKGEDLKPYSIRNKTSCFLHGIRAQGLRLMQWLE